MILAGVDAGATTTRAVVAGADGRVMGRAAAGPGNPHNAGVEEATAAIARAVREASGDRIPDILVAGVAGIEDPEAEITLIIHYSRKRLGHSEARPSETVRQAQEELKRAADRVDKIPPDSNLSDQPEKKKRKIFNGIGKILAGTITGAGNLLLAAGTVVAPNPATAYGVIGSSALAVGGICQGIGDLRGE